MNIPILGFVFLALSLAPMVRAECKGATEAEFKLLSQGKSRVVFFASWCKSCEAHLTADYAKDSVFVTSFDSADVAGEVLRKFLGADAAKAVCIIDGDERLAKHYKLKFLPFVAPL